MYRKNAQVDEKTLIMSEKKKQQQKDSKLQKKQAQKKQQQQQQKQQQQIINKQSCDCLATEHTLVGNCLNCGKIICSFENFPCSFCGHTNEKQHKTSSSSTTSSSTSSSTSTSSTSTSTSTSNLEKKQLEDAIRHKNKLVEYNRTSAQRTIIYGKNKKQIK